MWQTLRIFFESLPPPRAALSSAPQAAMDPPAEADPRKLSEKQQEFESLQQVRNYSAQLVEKLSTLHDKLERDMLLLEQAVRMFTTPSVSKDATTRQTKGR